MANKENDAQPKNLSLCMEDRPKLPSNLRITQSAMKVPKNNYKIFPMLLDYQKELKKLEIEKEKSELIKKSLLNEVLKQEDLEEKYGNGNSLLGVNSFRDNGTAEVPNKIESNSSCYKEGDRFPGEIENKLSDRYEALTMNSSDEMGSIKHSTQNYVKLNGNLEMSSNDQNDFTWKPKAELQTPIQSKKGMSLFETKTNYSSSSSSAYSSNSLDTPNIFSRRPDAEKPWFMSKNLKSSVDTPVSASVHNKRRETPQHSTSNFHKSITDSRTDFEMPVFTSTHHKDILKSVLEPISESSSKEFKTPLRRSDEDLGITPLSTSTQVQKPKVQCTIDVSSFMKTRPSSKLKQTRKSDEERGNSGRASDEERRNSGQMSVSFKRISVSDVDYVVLKQLGTGGSSVVYHCFDPSSKTECAIKNVNLNHEPNIVQGYINEVRTLQRLQHCKRVIKMHKYQILKEEKTMYVVLEKGGADLRSILKDRTKSSEHLPLYIIIFYWVEMLHAVKEIHSNGVIHSDLKPANFLEASGKIKLIDFGISSCVQQDSTSVIKNIAMGTFSYISPEALCGNKSNNYDSPNYGKQKFKISYKSDVWSLGCILYELVYRRTPFQHLANSAAKICTIIDRNHKIDYPEITSVPGSIIQTIKDCLQYDIKSRPSIDELISRYGQYYC